MPVRVDVTQRVVKAVLILIQRLRVCYVGVWQRLLDGVSAAQNKNLVRPALKFVRAGEPPLRERVVPGDEVVQSRLVISLFVGEHLSNGIALIAPRVGATHGVTPYLLAKREIVVPRHARQTPGLVYHHSRGAEFVGDQPAKID